MPPDKRLIVGIGASAGGLEALEQFFSLIPADSGLAYVVVQHLAPQHASLLAQLLSRKASIPVLEAKHGEVPQADHIYVIVPGTLLGISGGAFVVSAADVAQHGQIDAFLISLAQDLGTKAVGLILSGSGKDGAEGLRAIKQRGGFTLVQSPDTAKYDAMPKSAISLGVVDSILSIEQMAAKLIEHRKDVEEGRYPAGGAWMLPPTDDEILASSEQIWAILNRATGHDFSHYKRGTLFRRLRNRLGQLGPISLERYVKLLETDEKEPERLAKYLMIGVTQFFRNQDAFQYLGLRVVPKLIASKAAGQVVKIWVPGCASGEEAYSIAILLYERLSEMSRPPSVQIFATDIDSEAIREARVARYPSSITEDVAPERLSRFFFKSDERTYQVVKEVRDLCIFSVHDLIRDPPFIGIDFISCRNLLMYLDLELQKKVIRMFHYALKRNGFLFLGSAEGLASYENLFEVSDRRFRVFKRAEVANRPELQLPLITPRMEPHAVRPLTLEHETGSRGTHEIATAFERIILQDFVPAGVVVNTQGEILCVVGPTSRYLQPLAGILTQNILDIAHTGLRAELRVALSTVCRSGKRLVREDVYFEVEGVSRKLRLEIRPLSGVGEKGLYAIVFQEYLPAPKSEDVSGAGEPVVEVLERELQTARASLKTMVEELESSNADLRTSNEELLSTNEQLHSSNEELESSQEELKSMNEELSTVNSELAAKVEELGRAHNNLQNLFKSTEVATLFLDRDQRVTLFTPPARAMFRLLESDIGRSVSDFGPRLQGADIAADAKEVLRTLQPIERTVENLEKNAWYLLRIFPYKTIENVISGTVITLSNISQIKEAETLLRQEFEATGRLLKIGMLFLREGNLHLVLEEILDAALVITEADFGAIHLIELESGHLKVAAQKGFPEGWSEICEKAASFKGVLGVSLEQKARVMVEDIEQSPLFVGTPFLDFQLKAGVRAFQSTPIIGRTGAPIGEISTYYKLPKLASARALRALDLLARQVADILERARIENSLKEGERRLRALMEASFEARYQLSPDWGEMRQLVSRGFLVPCDRPTRHWLKRYIPPEEWRRLVGVIRRAVREKRVFELEHRVFCADGTVGWAASRAIPVLNDQGEIVEWFGSASDLTERKRIEDELRAANAKLLEADRRRSEFLGILSHELRNPLAPIRNCMYMLGHATPNGERRRRAIAIVSRQVEHLTRLIDDLLDVTRINSGKIRLQFELVELNELVKRTVEDQRGTFSDCGVELEFSPAPEKIWIKGDRTRVSQMVGNLLQNAVKFTPAGGKTTVIVEMMPNQEGVAIKVRDTGRGVAPEMMARLFEPFSQIETSLDRSKGGLGLGLVVVKALAEMHGGTAVAESPGLGKGSTFAIRFPIERAPSIAEAESTPVGVPQRTSHRVLIIEDNADAAFTLREVLEMGGHQVQVASSGREGIQKAIAFAPEIVLCDIGLPEMDGYEVARAMRADSRLAGLKLVALTGYAGPEDIAQAKEAGFDDHLAKPPRIEAIERLLEGLEPPSGKVA